MYSIYEAVLCYIHTYIDFIWIELISSVLFVFGQQEVRTPKKARNYPSNSNSPVPRSPASVRTNTSISPSPTNQEVWRLRYHSSATSKSPLVRSISAPSMRSPFSPEQQDGGGIPSPQLFFRSPAISTSSDGGEVPNLPQSPHVSTLV